MARKDTDEDEDEEDAAHVGGAAAGGDATGADTEGDEATEGPYTPRERANVTVQRDCLSALNNVLQLYAAAAKTVWQTDDAEAEYLRLLTVGCIFAVFDAVLRMQALPAPTHLSLAYAGRAGIGGKDSQHQFAISLADFGQTSTLAKALDNTTLVSFPPMLTTRCRLIEYLTWLEKDSWQEGFETVKLFDWKCGEDKVMRTNFKVDEKEDALLARVLILSGLGELDMPTPGGTKPMLQAAKRTEAAGAWLADGWLNNGVYAHAAAARQSRNLPCMHAMSMCYL